MTGLKIFNRIFSSVLFSSKRPAYRRPPIMVLSFTDEILAWQMWLVDQQSYEPAHAKLAARWAGRWVEHANNELTPASCVAWLSDMSRETKLAPQTMRNRMSLCRQFAGWLVVQGRLQINPWVSIPAPRGRAGVGADAMTQDEVNRLIAAAERAANSNDGRQRNNSKTRATLYRLLNGTGMRYGEWKSQRWEDIDLNKQKLTVTKDKSRRRDSIPISESVVRTLRAWRKTSKGELVFEKYPTMKGLETDLKSCGITGRGKFHRLRVGFITGAFDQGIAPDLIQKLVRHKSIDQTHRYLRHKDEHLKSSIETISQIGKDLSPEPIDIGKNPCSSRSVFKPSTKNAANDRGSEGNGLEHSYLRDHDHPLQSDFENGRWGTRTLTPNFQDLIQTLGNLAEQLRIQNEQQGRIVAEQSRGHRVGNGSPERVGRTDRGDQARGGKAVKNGSDGDQIGHRLSARRCNPSPRSRRRG
jgi:integrase